MMYIAGETQEPSTKTVKLIEDIILDQVVHMVLPPPSYAFSQHLSSDR